MTCFIERARSAAHTLYTCSIHHMWVLFVGVIMLCNAPANSTIALTPSACLHYRPFRACTESLAEAAKSRCIDTRTMSVLPDIFTVRVHCHTNRYTVERAPFVPIAPSDRSRKVRTPNLIGVIGGQVFMLHEVR